MIPGGFVETRDFSAYPASVLAAFNIFLTVLDDVVGFDLLRAGSPRLAETAMFSSDYPHSVTLWPNSQKHISTLTKGIDAEPRQKVLAGNAVRVYGFGK